MTNFIIGVGLDIGTAGTRPQDVAERLSGATQLRAAQRLEAAGIDLLTLGDSLDALPPDDSVFHARLDALNLFSWLGPQTSRIGLIPTVTVTHTEPFLIGTATATLDYSARARSGWQVGVSTAGSEAGNVGRRRAADSDSVWREASEVVDVVRKLWDSWEEGAEIRDQATGRFLDLGQVHYVDFEGTDSVGETFTVKGPSIVPRPPQGNPVVTIAVDDEPSLHVAAQCADLVLLPISDAQPELESLPRKLDELRRAIVAAGRSAQDVRILGSLRYSAVGAGSGFTGGHDLSERAAGWRGLGLDGLHLLPDSLDDGVSAIVDELIPALRAAGVLDGQAADAETLRQRLGLPAAQNQYARR
ncbi:LLM class flavin-dependent oxidoreductase [Saxibacter everestensis]|uniref:LLM class flavin-dependent oxidoreductase n=1 Tax=Saxibacter everestensis TaxID=2909229 RepID=A0ABY8QQN4_9MICO|nr:LLM class flavin-dependent oxidoreductase [Brevibacteriaceae bacterium ZFBP1038]